MATNTGIPKDARFVPGPRINDTSTHTSVPAATSELVSWVMERVLHAREDRDQKHKMRWQAYTRMWRGFWDPQDKNRKSERSRLVSPAVQQAVEMTVAEIEEAIFNREAWFGLEDQSNEIPPEIIQIRDNLLYDFTQCGVDKAICNTFTLGTVYGTGIAKINVEQTPMTIIKDGQRVERNKPMIKVYEIRPDQFFVDPSAINMQMAAFYGHDAVVPLHTVFQGMRDGRYLEGDVNPFTGTLNASTSGIGGSVTYRERDQACLITEYYGYIPVDFIKDKDAKDIQEYNGMVEAIVIIANETTLLKAIVNPFSMRDRPIVAYQHDTIPGEFWGRGVPEKGFNPQKGLDAELRARMDALALMINPMMGADITRLGRNADGFAVRAGGTVLTRGRPSEVLEPVGLGDPSRLAITFQQTGDLERMIQMATGAMDSAAPNNINRRNETASGMSQLNTSFVKRTRRTLKNISRQFLNPLIRKSLWRYAQYDSNRYPQVFNFKVNVGSGIVAKEVENAQLTQMIGYLEQGSGPFNVVLQSLFENTTSSEKQALMEAMREYTKPPTPEQQKIQKEMQALQLRASKAEVEKEEAEGEKKRAEAKLALEKARHERIVADLEDEKVEIQASNTVVAGEKARIMREQLSVADKKVEVDRIKANKMGSNSSGKK